MALRCSPDAARAAQGQERILVHCAVVSKGGKTVSKDKETGGFKRMSTQDYAISAEGVLVASYRIASIAADNIAVEALPPVPLNFQHRRIVARRLALRHQPREAVYHHARHIEHHLHVGEPVRYALEATDRPAELHALLGVLDRRREDLVGAR